MASKFFEPLFDFEEELVTNSDEELLQASQHFQEVGGRRVKATLLKLKINKCSKILCETDKLLDKWDSRR